jgi:hypothetical protein
MEEVMFVLSQGNRILSLAGESLVSLIEDFQSGRKFQTIFIFS